MKTMKVALLATAGLAAVSMSARADEVTDLKAQLESLNARVAQLEATPNVPTGYNLLAFSETDAIQAPSLDSNASGKAHTVSVVPSADMPAAAEIQWSGYVRAAIVYVNSDLADPALINSFHGDNNLDVYARGQLNVAAKTDTSVGEVGVKIGLRAEGTVRDNKPGFVSNEYWGWWSMTPEWTLGGGYTGSLSNVVYGFDAVCTCYITDASTAFDLNPGDAKQMRLSYASGPLSFGVAVEDGSTNNTTDDDSLGVAARLNYSGDAFSAGLSGGYWGKDDGGAAGAVNYQIGGGASFALGDMANLSLGAAYGKEFVNGRYFAVSGAVTANLSDAVSVELGGAMKDYKSTGNAYAVSGGVYWKPVDQLTIGGEAEWNTQNDDDTFIAAFVTQYSF